MNAPTKAGQVGINCPSCGENLRHALIAKTHPLPGGQRRLRYCPSCQAPVDSIERVIGDQGNLLMIDVSSTAASKVRLIRALCREIGVPASTWGRP